MQPSLRLWLGLVLLSATLVSPLRGQQLDNPVYYSVSIAGAMTLIGPGSGNTLMPVSTTDETGQYCLGSALGAYPPPYYPPATYQATPITPKFYPNKNYTVAITVPARATATCNLAVLGPSGLDLQIDGNRGTRAYFDNSASDTGLNTTFTVRVSLPGNYPLAGAPSNLRAGDCSPIVADKPIWYVGLGRLRNGDPAGAVGFRRPEFDQYFFNPAMLEYDSPDTDDVRVVRVGGNIRQVLAPEVLVDVQTLSSTSYKLDVYPHAQVTGLENNLYTFSGSPFVTYTVSRINDGNGVDITRLEDGVTWDTSLVINGTTWTLVDWHASGAPDSHITTAYSTSYQATVSRTGPPASGSGSETPLTWTKTFADYGFSKELTSTTFGAGGTTPLVTQYSYYASTSTDDSGAFAGKISTIISPDGSWSRYLYYDGSFYDGTRGLVKSEFQPWLSGPTTPAADPATCVRTTYTYRGSATPGDPSWPVSAVTTAPGGTELARTEWSYAFPTGTLNTYHYRTITRADYADATNCLTTTTKAYWTGGGFIPAWLADRPVSVAYPNGTKEAYAYFDGTWDASGRTFTASENGNDRLVLVFHGQASGGTTVSSWANNGITWAMDAVGMVGGRSTVTESVIDSTGRSVFSAENIYTTSGTLVRLTGTLVRYDTHGRVTEIVDPIRSVGGTEVKTTRAFANNLLDSEMAADGVVTKYGYDALLRPTSKIIGFGGSGAYPGQTQQFAYDGANRLVQAYSCSCGTAPTTYTYDTAGRVSARIEPGPTGSLYTTYSYPNAQTVNVTLPSGATTSTVNYLDGRALSVTGTAQPTVYYDYAVNATGLLVTVRRDTNLNYGGRQDQYDRLGRVVTHTVPAWQYNASAHPSNLLDTAYTYNSSGQLTRERTTSRATGALVAPDQLHVYNSQGLLIRSGLDLNANGTLDDASNDRITTRDTWFATDGLGWCRYDQAGTFPGLNSGASSLLQETHTRYTGFNGGSLWGDGSIVVGDVSTVDHNGRAMSQRELIKPSERKRWSLATTTGVGNGATTTRLNGYQAETVAATGVKTGYEYDSLGRLQYLRERWNGSSYAAATSYSYHGNTSYVYQVSYAGIASTYAYAWNSPGGTRQVSVTDAAGNVASTLYNAMDLPWRGWGSAVTPSETAYDAWGRRTGLTTWPSGSFSGSTWPASPSGGAATTWASDSATGLVNTRTYADSRQVAYTYTALGQPATRTWARGVVTSYAYYDGSTTGSGDVSHRTQELRQVSYGDGGVTPTVSFTYTRTGQPNQVSDATGTRAFSYRADLQPDTESLDSNFYGTSRTLVSTYEDGSGSTVAGRAKGFEARLSTTVETGTAAAFDATTGRIATLTGNPTGAVFTYAYATGSNLLSSVTSGSYQQGFQYQANGNFLQYVNTTWSSAAVARFDYTYDNVGRRSSAVQTGSIFARYPAGTLATRYGYDSRSQLTSAATSHGSNPDDDTKRLSGRQYGYSFDYTGNRTQASVDGRASTYTNNHSADPTHNVNQYGQRSTPGYVDVTGWAPAASVVTVGSQTASRQGDYFYKSLTFGTMPTWQDLTVNCDFGGSETRHGFLAANPEVFTYDYDGNLTADGRWTNTWDAENRLVAMETRTAVVTPNGPLPVSERKKLEFKYDYMSR
ncbi:MAG: hypothetical protein PHE83_12795, partial [Opitutaceae bacterium]|nr:hypothetical protein [Opitutaceae bacterium]